MHRMDFVAVCELGREPVNSVNASVLGTVLRELVARYHQSRRAKLQLYDSQVRFIENLEIRRRKAGEDEGFESDEDATSTTSSCCLVDDHVFKGQTDCHNIDRSSPSSNSNLGSADSANSSGSSDTDDADIRTPSPLGRPIIEVFKIADVIICHTEPRYLNTIAWVIKRNVTYFDTTSRLGKTGVENSNHNCLEVIVIKCKLNEDFRNLCSNYRELSRRLKLDQYKSMNRKKPIVLSTLTDTKDVKVSLADMKVERSSLLKASELSILHPKIITSFKSDLKNSVSLNSLLKSDASYESPYQNGKEALKKCSSLSNIAPGKFNLLQRTDLDGMTHIEVSKSATKSKIQKEIEGVIITDVESNAKKDLIRQRQNPTVLQCNRNWRPDDSIDPSVPPLRPERRKYTRKKSADGPSQNYGTLPAISDNKSKSKFYLPLQNNDSSSNKTVSIPQRGLPIWNEIDPKGIWHGGTQLVERLSRKSDGYCGDRRRARSVGRTTKKVPMAYRYIDIMQSPVPSPGLTKIEHSDQGRRRRNSFDDLTNPKSTLKSVIKSTKKMSSKFTEPKKVTFSAFATVQVVD